MKLGGPAENHKLLYFNWYVTSSLPIMASLLPNFAFLQMLMPSKHTKEVLFKNQ